MLNYRHHAGDPHPRTVEPQSGTDEFPHLPNSIFVSFFFSPLSFELHNKGRLGHTWTLVSCLATINPVRLFIPGLRLDATDC